jgi:hypothetical protein
MFFVSLWHYLIRPFVRPTYLNGFSVFCFLRSFTIEVQFS